MKVEIKKLALEYGHQYESSAMLRYGADTLLWAIERAEAHTRAKWKKAMDDAFGSSDGPLSFTITPEFLSGLADSLRMRAEDMEAADEPYR